MTSREQKDALKRSLHYMDVPIRPSHLIETQSLAREGFRPGKRKLSFWEFLGAQVRFIGWKIWLSQAVTLLFLCGIFFLLWGRALGSPRTAGMLLCCCSLLTFMTALPFLHRARRYGMCEVEMAARTSGLKQLGGKLMIIGIGDFAMLGSIFCFLVAKTSLSPGGILLSLLLPFLAASSGLLYLIGHTPGSKWVQNSVVVCGVLFLGFSLLTNVVLFRQELKWAAVCAALAVCCVCQARTVFRNPAYEESLLL